MHGLAVYVKEGLPFARDLSLENSADSYLCFRLALLHSVSYFFFLCRPPSLSLCAGFISSNIDEVLSINPSAIIFVFGDFNIHHKDWLTYSGGTDRPGELCCDSVAISNDLTEMVNFPTRITCCDSQSYSFRFISFFWPWYLFYKAFPSREILIMLLNQFPLTFFEPKRDALFIKQLMTILVMLGLVFMTIWEIYHGIFTFRVLNIFKHGVSATATKFYEWV